MDHKILSKEISYALRHAPEKYGLSPDSESYVPVAQLISAIDKTGKYERGVTLADLEYINSHFDKKRFEISDGRIRALYGHSIAERVEKAETVPPDILYHGTPRRAVGSIMCEGLKPMKRQYVHLSKDTDTAVDVGRRRDSSPVILRIDAKKAHESGIRFYEGNDAVILCDNVPPEFIHLPDEK